MSKTNVIAYYIAEAVSSSIPEIVKKNDRIVKFNAILQDGNSKNRNGRIYPTEVLREALNDARIKERVASNTWLGEAGHPFSKDIQRLQDIDLGRVSHVIKDYRFEGDVLHGTIETASEGLGKGMRGLIVDNKSRVSFSMRGFAKLETMRGRENVVAAPLKILTYDWVVTPSHQTSIMTNLIQEGVTSMDTCNAITEAETSQFLLENSDSVNLIRDFLIGSGDIPLKTTISKDARFATVLTESGSANIIVEEHVRANYFRLLK